MNALLLNRDGFQMPADGWYQLAPLGEFAHAQAGVVQVVDAEACTAMAARFKADAAVMNFAGLLVDFDHFSLGGESRTEAAGWIVGLEYRDLRVESEKTGPDFEQKVAKEAKGDGPSSRERCSRCGAHSTGSGQAGLWVKIRWSDVGEETVKGETLRKRISTFWHTESRTGERG